MDFESSRLSAGVQTGISIMDRRWPSTAVSDCASPKDACWPEWSAGPFLVPWRGALAHPAAALLGVTRLVEPSSVRLMTSSKPIRRYASGFELG
jgi:hypothetical protein